MAFVGPYVKNDRSQALMDTGLQNILGGLQGIEKQKENERARALASLQFAKEQGYDATSPEFQEAYKTGNVGALTGLAKTAEYSAAKETAKKMQEMELLTKKAALESTQAGTKKTLAEIEKIANEAKGGLDPQKKFEVESTLRQEINKEPEVRDFVAVKNSYSGIKKAAKDASPAGDLSLIFSFMKMVDPTSSVREGEFANAQNAAAVPDRIRNLWNNVQTGQKLNPTQRSDFIKQAENLYKSREENVKPRFDYYKKIASKAGLDVENVIYSPQDVTQQEIYRNAPVTVSPAVQPKPAQGFDAAKEARYQAWKQSQGIK